jgi:hypothetical protein
MGKLALGAVAGVGHRVDLGEPEGRDVPVIGLDGDLVLQQGPGLGRAMQAAAALSLARPQAPIDLSRTDLEHLALELRGQDHALPQPGQPQGKQSLQAHRPGIAGGLADEGQGLDDLRRVRRATSSSGPRMQGRASLAQQPDRVLAMVAAHPTELVEDLPLFFRSRFPLARQIARRYSRRPKLVISRPPEGG